MPLTDGIKHHSKVTDKEVLRMAEESMLIALGSSCISDEQIEAGRVFRSCMMYLRDVILNKV